MKALTVVVLITLLGCRSRLEVHTRKAAEPWNECKRCYMSNRWTATCNVTLCCVPGGKK